MAVFRAPDAVVHEVHGSRFHSFVAPDRGSHELCAWRLEVPAGLTGMPHRPSREEVLLVLTGSLRVTVDGEMQELFPGDLVLVPAHCRLSVGAGPDGATAWVTTTPGLEATMADGSVLRPPWAN